MIMQEEGEGLTAVLELKTVCTDMQWPDTAREIRQKAENELAKESLDQLGN